MTRTCDVILVLTAIRDCANRSIELASHLPPCRHALPAYLVHDLERVIGTTRYYEDEHYWQERLKPAPETERS